MQTSQWIQAAGEVSGAVLGLAPMQEGGADSATSGALGGTVTGADGSTTQGGQNPPPPTGGGMQMIWIIMLPMLLLLIFSSVMGGRKEKKKRAELMASLKKHDKVQTIGGIIGTVVELSGDEVVLRVDETSKTRVRFSRTAIQQILRGGGGPETSAEAAHDAATSNGVVEKAAV